MNKYGNEIRLIAADIDGTLLTSENKMLPSTEAAIREIIDADSCAFSLSTGRPYIFAQPIADHLNIRVPYSFSGGAIYDPVLMWVLFKPRIDNEQMEKIIGIADKYKIGLLVHTTNDMFCMVNDRDWEIMNTFEWMEGKQTTSPQRIKDVSTAIAAEIIRLDLFAEVNWLTKVSREVQNEVVGVDAINMKRSIEISESGMDKGSALRRIASSLNIPLENTMAIGDSMNDVSLIMTAGFGVAMESAPQDLKDAADAVVPSADEDGFVKALELIA